MMIGALISWIPFVGAVGGLVGLIGAIFIIIGREAFGPAHSRNVIASIIIFVVGVGVTAVGVVLVFFTAISAAISNPGTVPVEPTGYTIVILVAGAIIGIAEVVFTYGLQNTTGRILLWTAFILGIITGIVNSFLVLPGLAGTTGFSLITETSLLTGLLAAPSAVLYGIAFYTARERIERKEIPQQLQQGPGPTAQVPRP